MPIKGASTESKLYIIHSSFTFYTDFLLWNTTKIWRICLWEGQNLSSNSYYDPSSPGPPRQRYIGQYLAFPVDVYRVPEGKAESCASMFPKIQGLSRCTSFQSTYNTKW